LTDGVSATLVMWIDAQRTVMVATCAASVGVASVPSLLVLTDAQSVMTLAAQVVLSVGELRPIVAEPPAMMVPRAQVVEPEQVPCDGLTVQFRPGLVGRASVTLTLRASPVPVFLTFFPTRRSSDLLTDGVSATLVMWIDAQRTVTVAMWAASVGVASV